MPIVNAAEIRAGQERDEVRSDIEPDVRAVENVAFTIGLETQWLHPGRRPKKMSYRTRKESQHRKPLNV
jgi:hypothetical protein